MVDPPRLHQKLGAIWVEVTKTVLAVGRLKPSRSKKVSDFENAASNSRLACRSSLQTALDRSTTKPELLPSTKREQPGSASHSPQAQMLDSFGC
jgi:hypothetical protein